MKGFKFDNYGSLAFKGDFLCMSGFDYLQTKKGKMRAISSKWINLDGDDGIRIRLRLGWCSQIEGQGANFVPQAGQIIHWKGSRNVDAS